MSVITRIVTPAVAVAAVLAACSHSGPSEPDAAPPALVSAISVNSALGCALDDDCDQGLFCFQRRCVAECQSDADCPAEAHCSTRARCLVAGTTDDPDSIDQEDFAASASDLAGIEMAGWPADSVLRVPPGASFIAVALTTSAPVPSGRLLYSVQMRGEEQIRVLRAEGSTTFTLELPTGTAGSDDPSPQVVQVVTAIDSRTLVLAPTLRRAGWYAGAFRPGVFGGAGLPLEVGIQTVPDGVNSLAEAEQAWLWLPTSSTFLVSLDGQQGPEPYVRAPLTWDADISAWVAVFSETLAADRYFGDDAFPMASRALRVEVLQEADGTIIGAIADRWRGLFDRRSVGGSRTPGVATISGQFNLRRTGKLPAISDVRESAFVSAPPAQQPPPSLEGCASEFFAIPACDGIGAASAFAAAPPSDRVVCALAIAQSSLAGQSVGNILTALIDPTVADPPGLSFSSFIETCASPQSALCKPTPKLSCARALVATAYLETDLLDVEVQDLVTAYDATTKEAFLGRQLAAFQVDTRTRLAWLQTSEAPAFLASTLRDFNMQILNSWRGQVLDAHLAGVFGQLDLAGLAVLTRAPSGAVAISKRQALLLDLANSWRAAMDALVLLSTRWNVLHSDASSREQATAYVRTTSLKLYVSAAIIQTLAQETGASYLGTTFGSGFSVLLRELNRLSLPFDALLFARDAEVVTSRSLDPNDSSQSLLGERELAARTAIADAAASVDLVLSEAQQTSIDEAALTARYEDQIITLRNELISLCGLPEGCTASEVGAVAACNVPTRAGRCGFFADRQGNRSSEVAVSEAGNAVLSLKEAGVARQEADAHVAALVQKANLVGATTEAFADKVADWDRQRRGVSVEIDALVAEMMALDDLQIAAQIANLRAQQVVRRAAYDHQAEERQRWNVMRFKGANLDLKSLKNINELGIASTILGTTADRIDLAAEIVAEGLPESVGVEGPGYAGDTGWSLRLGYEEVAFVASTIMLGAATTVSTLAANLSVVLEGEQAMREAKLEKLTDLADLASLESANDIAALQALVDEANVTSADEADDLQALVEALQRNLAFDQAHERDLQELADRRDAWRLMLVDMLRLEYAVMQAELTMRQRELAYFQVVQRAQLLEGRFLSLQGRFSDLQNLIGSPDVIFSFANRMARAESRIDRARRALEEWLVALEYFAVRPFVDQRMAILLARNPSQLEAISNEFLRLQRACGGPVTIETVDLSLRDDLLGIGFSTERAEGVDATPEARFRALMARAQTPVNLRVPYSATQTLGQRLGEGNIWAASFALSVEEFANLSRTCNAKIASVAVQLVGEGFSGQPVASVVHDGASQMRSCQPGIDTLVQALGPGTTAFASVTDFKSAGRTVSPIAAIGDFGAPETWNASLEGLPLAAGYTVLIDLDHPSNASIPWSELQDVRLQIRYSYQDVFPEGQCQ